MSLGRRIVKRGRIEALARLASYPREPLPFLYPAWTRNSSTTPIRNATDFTSSIPQTRPTVLDHTSNGQKGEANEVAFTETGAGNLRDDDTGRERSHFSDADHTRNHSNAEDNSAPTVSQGHGPASLSLREAGEPKTTVRRVQSISEDGRGSKSVAGSYKETAPIVRKLYQSTQKVKDFEARKRADRISYQEDKRKETESWDPDWRVVLSDLSTHTPRSDKWLDRALKIIVPDEAVGKLMYGVDTNMWDIGARYGCLITLDSRNPQTGVQNSFLLSGSETGIKTTTLDLLRLVPDMSVIATPKSFAPTGDNPVAISAVDECKALDNGSKELKGHAPVVRNIAIPIKRKVKKMRADRIPRPAEWTQRSFLDYVNDLCSIEMPNHLHRGLYTSGERHTSTVCNILQDIFQSPECASAVSRAAFGAALAYFVKTGQIKDVRRLFVRMELMNVMPDVETFNIMLRGAAGNEDIHNFRFLLHLMFRRGISPNAGTWLAFMLANPNVRIKLYILSEMRELGLLNQASIAPAVCEQLALFEINTSLDKGESQEGFLRRMDSRYGADWLNLTGGNQILHGLGSRGLISRCWEFLKTMEDRAVKPDVSSISTIIHHCRYSKNIDGAIEILRDLPRSVPPHLGQRVYHDLFGMACQAKAYNFARVVWRYACLTAFTTGKMRERVRASLLAAEYKPTEGTNALQRWHQQMGYFVTGHDGSRSCAPGTLIQDDVQRAVTANQSAKWSSDPANAGRPYTIALARQDNKSRLEEDLCAFEDWCYVRPFAEMLAEAWRLDLAWRSIEFEASKSNEITEEVEASRTLSWKLEHGISVPVAHRLH